jgi:hypothetical protein
LADLVIFKTMTSTDVCKYYNIGSNQLRAFVNKRKKNNGRNYDCKGRCPKLDVQSSIAIEKRYKEGNLVFDSKDEFQNDLKETIRAEAICSYQRKTGKHFENKIKGISKIISSRTLNRRVCEYMKLFLKYVSIKSNNNNNDNNDNNSNNK